MNIQSMKATDLDSVLEIEKISFLNPWPRAFFLDELEKRHARSYIVSHNGCEIPKAYTRRQVDGYACFNVAADELHLLKMAVRPEMRNRKIALHFLETCFSHALEEKLSCVFLEVRRSNETAVNLYEKLGFRLIAVRPDYYPGNAGKREDALIMRKILKGGSK